MEEIKVPFSNGVFLNDVSLDELEVYCLFNDRKTIWWLIKMN
jgi:hypothetical protein